MYSVKHIKRIDKLHSIFHSGSSSRRSQHCHAVRRSFRDSNYSVSYQCAIYDKNVTVVKNEEPKYMTKWYKIYLKKGKFQHLRSQRFHYFLLHTRVDGRNEGKRGENISMQVFGLSLFLLYCSRAAPSDFDSFPAFFLVQLFLAEYSLILILHHLHIRSGCYLGQKQKCSVALMPLCRQHHPVSEDEAAPRQHPSLKGKRAETESDIYFVDLAVSWSKRLQAIEATRRKSW